MYRSAINMGNSIRILHIAAGDGWGGAESQLVSLLRSLRIVGDVESYVISLNRGLFTERLSEAGIAYSVIEESTHNAFMLWMSLRAAIKDSNPDIVHTHGYKQNILGSLAAARNRGARCVRTQHGDWEIPSRLLSQSALYRLLDMFSARFLQDCVVAVSDALGNTLGQRLPRQKIVVVRNGVDTEALGQSLRSQAIRPQNTNFVIAFVGRLVPVKRIDLFLQAAALIVHQTTRPVRFRVFGDGPLRAEATVLAEQLGIIEQVEFCGFLPNLPAHLAASDLLVMTSDHEGLPMVLLEALYLQVPIVAPAVGGIPEILCENHGALVDKQTPQAYAKAIKDCMDRDPSLSHSMEQAPDFIERHYSAVRQANAYKEVYQQVLNQT